MKVTLNLIALITLFYSEVSISETMPTPMPAGHLFSACNNNSKYAQGFCDGAIDALQSGNENWCVPSNVTHGEVKQRVKKALTAPNANLTLSALSFVNNVLKKEWPCN